MDNLGHIQSWLSRMKRDPSWQILLESVRPAFSGAIFGAALTAAGVYQPAVIINQFQLKDFRMFHVFTVALSSSVFAIYAFDRLNIVKRQIRSPVSLGLFSTYDGNIVGGALVGLGMSMAGSCPGTVTAQLAQGTSSAAFTALGGVLGGMAYLWIHRSVENVCDPASRRPFAERRSSPRSATSAASLRLPTLATQTGLNESIWYAIFGTIATSLLFVSIRSATPFWKSAGAGGLYIGLAQLISLVATTSTLGASGVYDQAGRYAWQLLGVKTVVGPPMPPKSLFFAVGAILGSVALSSTITTAPAPMGTMISASSALVGGFMMAYGAKTAKGCTSGHGLSGLGSLSFSSLITVASMFGAGIAYQFL